VVKQMIEPDLDAVFLGNWFLAIWCG